MFLVVNESLLSYMGRTRGGVLAHPETYLLCRLSGSSPLVLGPTSAVPRPPTVSTAVWGSPELTVRVLELEVGLGIEDGYKFLLSHGEELSIPEGPHLCPPSRPITPSRSTVGGRR